jgi:hypothetical protein
MVKRIGWILIFLIILVMAKTAFADDICSDRPGAGSSTCAVPYQHWQIESDIYNGTWSKSQGVRGTNIIVADPTIKYGIAPYVDVELTVTPYVNNRSGSTLSSGIGDAYLRSKWEFIHNDKFDMAVVGIVKVPLARNSIGNGVWESGIQFPTTYDIDKDWAIAHTSEIDLVKNVDNNKTHVQVQESVALSRDIPNTTATAQAGLASIVNYDRKTVTQYSFNVAASWIQNHDTQWDMGFNFGLNKYAPGTQFYVGISKKF